MPGFNQTGQPNTDDYLLGRGCLMLAFLDPATDRPLGYRILGNAPAFAMTSEEDTLAHFNSKKGLRAKDKEVTVEKEVNWNCTLDEISWQNLSLFFAGQASEGNTNAATTGIASYQIIPDGLIEPELNYKIMDAAGISALGFDPADLTIATTAGAPVTLAQGTDYTVDPVSGLFFLLDSTAVQTAIGAGEGLTLELTADGAIADIEQTTMLTNTISEVALFFKGVNPADGDKEYVAELFKTNVAADGDLNLITENEWAEIPLSGSAQRSNYQPFDQYGSYGRFYNIAD